MVLPPEPKTDNSTHTLYMWSTERYREVMIRPRDNKTYWPLAKVGETQELDAEIRIAQTDKTGNAEMPQLIRQWTVPTWLTDKRIHRELAHQDYPLHRTDKDREWVRFNNCQGPDDMEAIVERTINKLLTGVSALKNYLFFDYQKEIVDWAVDRYINGDTSLLVDAIMRAGKCFISYGIVKKLRATKVLILTSKPGAFPSWKALVQDGEEEHVDFSGFKLHDYKDHKKSPIEFDRNECDVVIISLQYAHKHLGTGKNKLLNQVLSIDWDLVIEDEQHAGTQTEKAKRFKKQLKTQRWLELSGTPYKTLISGRLRPKSIKSFDYIQEQKIRTKLLAINDPYCKQTELFKHRARINWALIGIPDKVKKYFNDENFNLGARGIFATDKDNELVYQAAVSELIELVKKVGYKNPPKKFRSLVNKLSRHTLWVLPKNVAAIKQFARMLKEHPYFKKYDIIVATGNSKTDNEVATVKDIDSVKRHISDVEQGESKYQGTITLTCGRFLEGTSVPEWWAVHQLNDAKSAEDYFQGSFRNKTPNPKDDKQDVIVFDYNPERFVSVMYEYVEQKARTEEKDPKDVAIEFMECSDVYDYLDNDYALVDGAELQNKFLQNIGNIVDRIGANVRSDSITDKMKSILDTKKEDSKSISSSTDLNQNGLTCGSNQNRTTDSDPTANNNSDEIDYTARLRYGLKQVFELVNIAWSEQYNIQTFNDIINYKDIQVVTEVTGLSPAEWKIMQPAIDVTGVNRALGQFNNGFF